MKTKLLKKLRKKFFKKVTVETCLWTDGVSFRVYDEGINIFTSWNSDDLHLRLRELYFRYLEEYVAEHRKSKTRLTYWW